jgi:predicted ATPase/DNA-binding XRE family transcriptional regulator
MSQEHSFGYWLKRSRKALDLTQAELAMQVGYSAETIRKLEAEERRPSAQIVERLAEILGVPREERTAFLRFARGDWRSAPVEMKETIPWQIPESPPRTNLPSTSTSFIGREREIFLVREYLLREEIRLVTLTGPPGIGKTRLSIEAARTVLPDFRDGIFFVPLAPLDNPALIVQTIAQALGYVKTRHQSADEQLIAGIGNKELLIVLDNCEHLIEEVAILVSRLLSVSSHLKILATSRESLRIPGEWIHAVPALQLPKGTSALEVENASAYPALTLFSQRARAVRPDFGLQSDNLATIASICAQLDGLPLAIELMAARMRLMTPRDLLKQLNNDFALSADGMRPLSPRHKTLNDAIRWSYNLLPKEEQSLFAYLSIFSGGFTLETVESIFSRRITGKSAAGVVTSLWDKSLLHQVSDPDGAVRFSMLVTIQQFALHCLQDMGNEEDVRNAHLAYFLNLAEQADSEIHGPDQVRWFRRLSAERDNLRSALEWAIETGQTETALLMACNLSLFWLRRSDLGEGRQWLGRVAALPNAVQYPLLHSHALAQLAFHTWLQMGPKDARPFVEQALTVAGACNDKRNIAWALTILGLVLISEGNFTEAQSVLEESKAFFREIHDEWGYANAVISLGNGAYHQGDQATALALHEESLPVFRKLGDSYFQGVALRFIGMLQIKLGNATKGLGALQEALALDQEIESKYEIASVLRHIAHASQSGGDPVRAVYLFSASKSIFAAMGAWQPENEVEFERDLAPCRTALGDKAFSEAMEHGRTLTMEQAIAHALADRYS